MLEKGEFEISGMCIRNEVITYLMSRYARKEKGMEKKWEKSWILFKKNRNNNEMQPIGMPIAIPAITISWLISWPNLDVGLSSQFEEVTQFYSNPDSIVIISIYSEIYELATSVPTSHRHG